jgi:hypothetical protein
MTVGVGVSLSLVGWRVSLRERNVDTGPPRYARRRFSNAVTSGIPRLVFELLGIFCRRWGDKRRGAGRRVSGVVSCDIPRLVFVFLWLCRDGKRPDARRRFSIVMSYGVSLLVFAFFGVLCRRRGDGYGDLRRRVVSVTCCVPRIGGVQGTNRTFLRYQPNVQIFVHIYCVSCVTLFTFSLIWLQHRENT